ncbi:ER membrane protein SH3-domain-containing protein [Hypoxylon trugodes]|uniref:ER membrane protein SH3-domain-containing protein n=1 Tax=Hypoxylon trugodes TaxID=326681 RepID=UPI00219A7D08|nr:ER membrane protein SH3-domain-containing protein [Hypoxylon trugodes]KAI1390228.1 ER membrane protein SH3-domain-containing protein [Hypoxylon trugodes]
MGDVEGVVCETCMLCFHRITTETPNSFNIPHHQEYDAFVKSEDNGCFTCNWLWAKHTPPQSTDEIRRDNVGEFKISFKVTGNKEIWRTVFHVECSWAADTDLEVYMSRKKERIQDWGCSHRMPWSDIEARPWSTFDPNIGSSQSLGTIQNWISTCQTNHKYCKPPQSESKFFFPTRVIDVGKADRGIISLRGRDEIITEGGTTEKEMNQQTSSPDNRPIYWSLSHRWGDPTKIRQLLKTTESELRKGISLDDVSPTFRDAALLVHRLGHRYIWIDSLCIFQDSASDWQKEAGTMKDVYRNSFCNISAICSSFDPTSTGLFGTRMAKSRLLYPFVVNLTNGPWIVWNDSIWFDDVNGAPLSTRGWVVQERFLSPRIVHFTKNQMYWECLESTHCETDPTGSLLILSRDKGKNNVIREYKDPGLQLAKSRARLAGIDVGGVDESTAKHFHYQHWYDMASTYASCGLTKESDRLIAMSGIAKTFQEVSGDKYLAGLWERKIDTELTWITKAGEGAQVRRSESYAPSWSWVSVTGGGVEIKIPGEVAINTKPLFKLVDMRIVTEPPGGDTTGLLRSAELHIEGAVYPFNWEGQSKKLRLSIIGEDKTRFYYPLDDKNNNLILDTSDLVKKFAEGDDVEGVCVPISTCFFLGILFAMFPYDFPLLWTKDPISSTYLDQLEIHLKFLHQSPPLIARVLSIMVGIGFLGFFIKLFRASESNMLFDGASLVLYLIGVGVYIANIVKGLRLVSAGAWNTETGGAPFDPVAVGVGRPGVGGGDPLTGGEIILGREDSLKVMAASNTILALVLVGVLVLQAGQWYAERKDNEEYEKLEMEKEKSGPRPSSPTAEKTKKKQ